MCSFSLPSVENILLTFYLASATNRVVSVILDECPESPNLSGIEPL